MAPLICFYSPWICLPWVFHVWNDGIFGLYVGFLSLNIVFSTSITMNQNMVPCSGWIIVHNMDLSLSLSIHQNDYFGLFLLSAIMNNPVKNIYTEVFTWKYVFNFLGIYLEWVSGSCSISLFNFLINCQTVFQSSCPILLSNQQCMRVSVLLITFFIIAILVGVKFYLIVTLDFLMMLSLLAVSCFLWTNISLNP